MKIARPGRSTSTCCYACPRCRTCRPCRRRSSTGSPRWSRRGSRPFALLASSQRTRGTFDVGQAEPHEVTIEHERPVLLGGLWPNKVPRLRGRAYDRGARRLLTGLSAGPLAVHRTRLCPSSPSGVAEVERRPLRVAAGHPAGARVQDSRVPSDITRIVSSAVTESRR